MKTKHQQNKFKLKIVAKKEKNVWMFKSIDMTFGSKSIGTVAVFTKIWTMNETLIFFSLELNAYSCNFFY